MKKLVIVFVLMSSVMYSQNFQGKAIYKTYRKFDVKMSSNEKAPSKEKEQLLEQLKKQFQKTYVLNFSKTASTYTESKELDTPKPKSGGITITISGRVGGDDVLYKNVKEKRYAIKKEVSGKRFLIQDSLPIYNWKMTSEIRKIGRYTCYKAISSREEEHTSSKMTDGKLEETKKMVTVTTEAWYTPEIPIANGPDLYSALPGLILEVKEGKKITVCTEIVVNPTKKIKIKEPTRGKKVSQKQYDTIMDKKTKEMIERFNNKRKSKDSKTTTISIGS